MDKGLAYFINNKSLELREIALEPLKVGYVRVLLKCSGINRADILTVKGIYPSSKDYGPIPGLEFSGIVVEANSTKKNWQNNTKVIGLVEGGAYSTIIDVPESSIRESNADLTFEELACIPESYCTAYLNLVVLGGVNNSSRVLVYSAAGGVGLSALQIVRSLGGSSVAVVGTLEKGEYIKKLGFPEVVNYKNSSFQEFVNSNKSTFTHILDTVGASNLSINCDMLAYKGTLNLIGLLGGSQAEINLSQVLIKNLRIQASSLRTQDIATKSMLLDYISDTVLPEMSKTNSSFSPCLDSVFSYKSINEAFEYMIQSKNTGNIVLNWDIY